MITREHPEENASIHEWVGWFWSAFFPNWIEQARAPNDFGFFDALDENANPLHAEQRTLLAQARLLYTFSHLGLMTKNPVYIEAAQVARDALTAFELQPGAYCKARSDERLPTDEPYDALVYSYDQSFVLLGLATWGRLSNENIDAELEACWNYLSSSLTDRATGLLLEHNDLQDPAQCDAPNRAQNPHMHWYEAALQAFEMTGNSVWLERARVMRMKGIEYFYDQQSGTIIEFIAPDLSTLPGKQGQRREVGHQYEWAWLLYREATLSGSNEGKIYATRLFNFADKHGLATEGVMFGAAFDAISSDLLWREDNFLLWPQTEAIKCFAIRKDQLRCARSATSLMQLIFQKYFYKHSAFVNQVDLAGNPIWPHALSRLHYHLVLALTEGARAGLWEPPK